MAEYTSSRVIILSPALPPEKENPIGIFGQRHLRYLKEHRRIAYVNLLTSGELNVHLADIDEQAQEMCFRLVEQIKQVQSITEQLRAENTSEWTAHGLVLWRLWIRKLYTHKDLAAGSNLCRFSFRKAF